MYVLADRHIRTAREAGALATLPIALNFLAAMLVLAGELTRAAELVAEETTITQATGAAPLPHARLMLAALRGRQAEIAGLFAAGVEDATSRGEGTVVTMAQYALAVLHNGMGNYDAALAAAERACEFDGELPGLILPELIEAAVRADEPARAAARPWRCSAHERTPRSGDPAPRQATATKIAAATGKTVVHSPHCGRLGLPTVRRQRPPVNRRLPPTRTCCHRCEL